MTAVLVVALGFVAYAGWRVWQVRGDLTAAQGDASRLQSALTAGDQAKAEAALDDLREHSGSAADRTDSTLWSMLGTVPLFGDDLDGIKVVSGVLSDLSDDGLPPLVNSAASLDAGSFTPKDGTLPIGAIQKTQQPVSEARGSFASADQRLQEVDSSGFMSSFKTSYDDLADRIHSASRSLDAAERATDVLPGFLGKGGKQTYLLIFQNNAELRSTGGLPSAGALVTADKGKVEMTRQVKAADFVHIEDKPALPLTAEETQLFGRQLGTFYQDANFTPDFPRTADLMAAHWKRNFDSEIDGVLSIDPVALSYLLKGTGPVTVDGVTLTSDNAVDELLNKIYIRLQDPEAQDEFFAKVAKTIFDKFSSGAGSPQELLKGLARSANEHRLLVHTFDEPVQSKIDDTVVAGRFIDDSEGPRIGVFLNDGTGSKMSYYLDYDTSVHSTGCAKGAQRYSGKIDLWSNTPEGVADISEYVTGPGDEVVPKGNQYLAMHIYAPQGGHFDGVFLDGQDFDVQYLEHDGHEVASMALFFKPGERRKLTFRMTGAEGVEGDTRIDVTPGTAAENESSKLTSAC
ncbi:hypothetical protein ASG90_00775 [Nocardioides sp. Soil797]|nr:hypothetical protein ASG90_00775 [Nocardioides sp. Soil797]